VAGILAAKRGSTAPAICPSCTLLIALFLPKRHFPTWLRQVPSLKSLGSVPLRLHLVAGDTASDNGGTIIRPTSCSRKAAGVGGPIGRRSRAWRRRCFEGSAPPEHAAGFSLLLLGFNLPKYLPKSFVRVCPIVTLEAAYTSYPVLQLTHFSPTIELGTSVLTYFCVPSITRATISRRCVLLSADDTMSSQLISRPHCGQCLVSLLTQSGAPIVFGGIPSKFSIRRTSSSCVSHLNRPGKDAGESYT
jgi:hypothetical protein